MVYIPNATPDVEFFFERGGFWYDPATETKEDGRIRCAEESARAELYAASHGWVTRWEPDPDGQRADAGTEWEDWPHWQAVLMSADGVDVLAALGGVMFADGGDPWSDPYRRVVEAELALDAIRELAESE